MHAAQPHYRDQVPMVSILALRHCTSRGVLTLCDCAKPLLARSIPDLKLDLLAIQLDRADLEVDTAPHPAQSRVDATVARGQCREVHRGSVAHPMVVINLLLKMSSE